MAITHSEVERETETIARRMARENGVPEGLWQMFLADAYAEHFGTEEDPDA